VGTLQDVTEHWQLREQRFASEARLRLAIEAGRMAVWEVDLASDVVTGSPELNQLLGFPRDAKPTVEEMRAFYYPGEGERLRGIGQAALARGERFFEAEFRYLWPDGSVRWLLLRAEVLLDAGRQPLRVIGVLLDVTDRRRTEEALREGEARLRLAQEAGGVGVWDMDLATMAVRWSPELYALFGLDPERDGPMTAERSLDLVHPDDRAQLQAAWTAAPTTGAMTAEFRISRSAPDGATEERWMLSRGRHLDAPAGTGGRVVGVNVDITDRKRAEERQRLLAREVDHRAKNALAVVQAAVRLTPKGDAAAYARAIEGRVNALARVHSLLAEGHWSGTGLRVLAEGELAPFLLPREGSSVEDAPRVELQGPAVLLGPTAAQALSMVLHELATNATKHGALAEPAGVVRLSWTRDRVAGLLRLRWAEEGGPPVPAPPTRRGFGSRVVEATVCGQLGGAVRRDWQASGLVCELEVPLGRLVTDLGGGTRPTEPLVVASENGRRSP
jgi:PAS domain S-box-containing protein